MGLAIRMAAAVTPPVLIGVLVWWGVMLAAPVVLVSALATTASRSAATSLWPPVARRSAASVFSPAGSASDGVVPGHRAAGAARLADGDDAVRPSAGSLPPLVQAPPPQRTVRLPLLVSQRACRQRR